MTRFENTETAFAYKSDRELRKAYYLFKIVGAPLMVKAGKIITKILLGLRLPIGWAIKPTIFSHFCGGETIDESSGVVKDLSKYHVKVILDYSVEGKEEPEDIRAALEETLRTIENASGNPNIPFAVFKPTAFTTGEILEKLSSGKDLTEKELTEAEAFRKRIDTLCKSAFEHNTPILIDAEDSWYQKFIDDVVEAMMEKYNREKAVVFNTLQMYRKDRLDFLKESYRKSVEGNYFLGIKFVRGAYMEKERARAQRLGYPDPINKDKEATDKMYDDGLRFTIEHINRISVFSGTHNENSNNLLTQLMENKGLAKDDIRVWFSQLYGMSDHISFNLAMDGYNVAKYLPYGPVKHVLPYLIRRAEENTSVAGQTSRELELIMKERKRRIKANRS
jgi:proline dehydrogenase